MYLLNWTTNSAATSSTFSLKKPNQSKQSTPLVLSLSLRRCLSPAAGGGHYCTGLCVLDTSHLRDGLLRLPSCILHPAAELRSSGFAQVALASTAYFGGSHL